MDSGVPDQLAATGDADSDDTPLEGLLLSPGHEHVPRWVRKVIRGDTDINQKHNQ